MSMDELRLTGSGSRTNLPKPCASRWEASWGRGAGTSRLGDSGMALLLFGTSLQIRMHSWRRSDHGIVMRDVAHETHTRGVPAQLQRNHIRQSRTDGEHLVPRGTVLGLATLQTSDHGHATAPLTTQLAMCRNLQRRTATRISVPAQRPGIPGTRSPGATGPLHETAEKVVMGQAAVR